MQAAFIPAHSGLDCTSWQTSAGDIMEGAMISPAAVFATRVEIPQYGAISIMRSIEIVAPFMFTQRASSLPPSVGLTLYNGDKCQPSFFEIKP